MANMTVSRLGQVNAGGATDALFMKLFAGEVLTNFEKQTVLLDKHWVRTIQNGKSASFPIIGGIAAAYHTPGTQIVGTAVNHAEKVIPVDGLLLSQAFIANIDEAMNHYDVRGQYSKEMGTTLAQQFDANVIQEGILGARSAALISGGNGGSQITNAKFKYASNELGTVGTAANLAEKSAALKEALFKAAEILDQKNAPKERFVTLRPAEVYALVQDTTVLNKDWGGVGAMSSGTCPEVAGIKILPSNNVPYTDLSGATYHGVNAAKTVGLVFCPEALGTVKLMDMSLQSEFLIEYQGTLMVARYAIGHGFLRPDALVELLVA